MIGKGIERGTSRTRKEAEVGKERGIEMERIEKENEKKVDQAKTRREININVI